MYNNLTILSIDNFLRVVSFWLLMTYSHSSCSQIPDFTENSNLWASCLHTENGKSSQHRPGCQWCEHKPANSSYIFFLQVFSHFNAGACLPTCATSSTRDTITAFHWPRRLWLVWKESKQAYTRRVMGVASQSFLQRWHTEFWLSETKVLGGV